MFNVYLIKAGCGDSFIIKVGENDNIINILVDGGPSNSNVNKDVIDNIEQILGKEKLNGIIVTHVDDDHIGGIISLFEFNFHLLCEDVFILYNSYDDGLITFEQGIELEEWIKRFRESHKLAILKNSYHTDRAETFKVNNTIYNKIRLSSILKCKEALKFEKEDNIIDIIILGPEDKDIKRLMKAWKENQNKKSNVKNKSSITFIIKYKNNSILMTGDADISCKLLDNLKIAMKNYSIDKIDYIKLSHHGSVKSNKNLKKLLDITQCKDFFLATDGTGNHPNMNVITDLLDIQSDIRFFNNYPIKCKYDKKDCNYYNTENKCQYIGEDCNCRLIKEIEKIEIENIKNENH